MKEKFKFALNWFFKSFIWLFIVMLAIDIATKQIILHCTPNEKGIIADWVIVRISFVLNYNAAFGIGASDHNLSRIIYLVVASVISSGIIAFLIIKRKSMKLYIRACLILIITGAIGNMVDRIFYGPEFAVVDWIDFYWFWKFNFNIADCCVVIGAFMLAIYVIVLEVKEYIKKRNSEVVQVKTLSKTEQERLEEEKKQNENKGENQE